jgi:hypothetical protein
MKGNFSKLSKGELKTPEFLTINPLGRVPAIRDFPVPCRSTKGRARERRETKPQPNAALEGEDALGP